MTTVAVAVAQTSLHSCHSFLLLSPNVESRHIDIIVYSCIRLFEAQESPHNGDIAHGAAAVTLAVLAWDFGVCARLPLATIEMDLVDAVPAANTVAARLTGSIGRTEATRCAAESLWTSIKDINSYF